MSELYSSFLKAITLWQYKLNKTISSFIKQVDDENFLYTYAIVLGIAFIYGLIHAAGPGNGKFLVAAYFIKGGNSYKDAFKMGYFISIIHTLSALILTGTLYFIIKTMFRREFQNFSAHAMLISAILIIIIGCYIIASTLYSKYKKNSVQKSEKSSYMIALSTGIVPCPGVMSIVLFSFILKHNTLAILSAITMSLGMGFTISVIGILSILFAKKTSKFVTTKGYLLEIFSGVLILILGSFLLLTQL